MFPSSSRRLDRRSLNIQGLTTSDNAASKGRIAPTTDNFLLAFKRTVRKFADQPALIAEGVTLTYGDLEKRAHAFAVQLVESGLRPGQVVAHLGNRDVSWAICVLGTWMAGGIYCPIDTASPVGRQVKAINSSGATILACPSPCTDESALEAFSRQTGATLLEVVGASVNSTIEVDLTSIQESVDSLDTCYILFTSGSTGVPKGAEVTSLGMMNHLLAKIEDIDIGPQDVIMQTAPKSFDVSVWQLIVAWAVGGTTVIVDPTTYLEASTFAQVLRRYDATVVQVVPSLLVTILESGEDFRGEVIDPLPLRVLSVTGEAMPPALAIKWLERYPKIPLLNAYGPTECSDDVTHYWIRSPSDVSGPIVPIGTALRNTSIFLLQETETELRLIGPECTGEIGEIIVAGICVGNGYVGNEEVTHTAFLQAEIDGKLENVYRTGDLGSRSTNGSLLFHGRKDRQFKRNGNRVELGEIESAILNVPAVLRCTVTPVSYTVSRRYGFELGNSLASPFANESKSLLLAFVEANPEDVSKDFLTELTLTYLPKHMIPDDFIICSALPNTTAGKIDIASLTADYLNRIPENQTKKNSTLNDNTTATDILFAFASGGNQDLNLPIGSIILDSLQQVRALNRINSLYGTNIRYRDFISKGSALEFIQSLKPQKRRDANGKSRWSAKSSDRVNATASQAGLWFLWMLFPDNPYYIFQGICSLPDDIDEIRLENAWRDVTCRHPILTARFVSEDNTIYFESTEQEAPFRIYDLTHIPLGLATDDALREVCDYAVNEPFDLSEGGLARVILVRLAEGQRRLIVSFHEIVADAWSAWQLVQMLDTAYALDDERGRSTENRHSHYFDYARDVYAQQGSKRIARQRAYWKSILKTLSHNPIRLPLKQQRPTTPTYTSASIKEMLTSDTSSVINRFCTENSISLFSTALAAYSLVLMAYSDDDTVVVGAPYASRDTLERETMLGYFLNMLPLVARWDPKMSFVDFVKSTADQVKDAIGNSDYAFADMVADSNAPRSTSFTPIFQVMFDMISFPSVKKQAGALNMDFREIEKGYNKYELNFYLYEDGDQIALKLSYLTEILDHSIAQKIFVAIIETLVSGASEPMKSLAELRRSLSVSCDLPALWNGSETSGILSRASLRAAIDSAFDLYKNRPYLTQSGETVSFGVISEAADKIVHELRLAGASGGHPIVLDIPHGWLSIAFMVACSRLQVPYLALNPDWSKSRKDVISKKVRPVLSLWQMRQDEEHSILQSIDELHAGGLEALGVTVARGFKKALICPDNLVAFIATSGTTGEPKLVALHSENVMERLESWLSSFEPQTSDVLVSHRPLSIVLHLVEVLAGLLSGTQTIVVSTETCRDPTSFIQSVEGATCLATTPDHLRVLLDHLSHLIDPLPRLRRVTCGGDLFERDLVKRFQHILPHTELLMTFGMTEVAGPIMIGETTRFTHLGEIPMRPLPGQGALIVSRGGFVPPVGVEGKLVLRTGAVGLELGSGKNRALDEILAPFPMFGAGVDTGDIARFEKDGGIVVTGRQDTLVTLGGFRISLLEVEKTISNIQHVARCAVWISRKTGTKRLVSAIVCAVIHRAHVSRTIHETLSSYMWPERILYVDEVPRSLSGKVDFSALDLALVEADLEFNSENAGDDAVSAVTAAWRMVLGHEHFATNDTFFSVGGTSLKVVRLTSLLGDMVGVSIRVRDVYRYLNTIEKIATFVERNASKSGDVKR